MDERELKELEDPGSWEDESAEMHPPSKKARAVVSVAFPRDDFERVADAAEKRGMKISEFIRNAALSQAMEHGQWRGPLSITDSRGGFRQANATMGARSRVRLTLPDDSETVTT